MTAKGEFAKATAVERSDWNWTADISPKWGIGSNPNGGYLISIGARAMLADSGQPDPWSITAHFMSPPSPGQLTVSTEVAKPGRTYSTVAGSLVQGDRERVRMIGAFGDLAARKGPSRMSALPPDLPPVSDCVPLSELGGDKKPDPFPEMMNRMDVRLPKDTSWGTKPPAERPLKIAGWVRFADGSEPDVISLFTIVDAMPPTVMGVIPPGWVPTVELTTHVRARPAPGWLRCVFRTRAMIDGMLEEDGEVWDSSGKLVALSRQLAMTLIR